MTRGNWLTRTAKGESRPIEESPELTLSGSNAKAKRLIMCTARTATKIQSAKKTGGSDHHQPEKRSSKV
jgi:hypothetical protein